MKMPDRWISGLPETPCGRGSTLASTESVRAALPELVRRYGIRTVVDAGAGDLNWISKVEWDVEYQPFDLVPRHPSVKPADITREVLPACDLMLCRHVLNHLDLFHVREALNLFKRAPARYLLATQFDEAPWETERRGWHPWNLSYWVGSEPLERIVDTRDTGVLALWKLSP